MKLAPAFLLEQARDRWQNGNGLFHVRDVTCREHASRARMGATSEAFADLRNAALTLNFCRKLKPRHVFGANVWIAIRWVLRS